MLIFTMNLVIGIFFSRSFNIEDELPTDGKVYRFYLDNKVIDVYMD